MPAIGMGLLWGGYTLIMWGYCQIRGYNISLPQLVMPGSYTGHWPPPLINDTAAPAAKPVVPQVQPGQHPGDMPWTYPPNTSGASATTTPGVIQV